MIENSPMGQTSIELTRGFLIYVNPQQDQFYRPFESNITGSGIQDVLRATDNGRLFNPITLSGVAGQLIMPSATPKGMVYIPNGFGIGRFAFFLEVTVDGPMGRRREILTGYTDTDAITQSGNIDPDLQFHINSMNEIHDYANIGSSGTSTSVLPRRSDQVLASTGNTPDGKNLVPMRPEDVIKSGQFSNQFPNDTVIDSRLTIGDDAKMSDRNNALPSYYMKRTVEAYLASARDISSDTSSSSEELYDGAISRVQNGTMATSKFCSSLGIREQRISHTVKFSEINAVWPRPGDFWKVVMPKPGAKLSTPLTNSEHWRGASVEHQVAFSITHVIPAIMARHMLMSLEFSCTNMGMGGEVNIAILGFTEMFNGTTTPNVVEAIKDQIMNDIVLGILTNRTGAFAISVNTSLIVENTIMISLNGAASVPFIAPMFCDSYCTPILGNDLNDLTNMNQGIESIVRNLDQSGVINNNFDPITHISDVATAF